MIWKNWKTISNVGNYHTESENPILKKDDHHAEIIDISDGLIVDEPLLVVPEYNLENHEKLIQDTIWDAFGNKKI